MNEPIKKLLEQIKNDPLSSSLLCYEEIKEKTEGVYDETIRLNPIVKEALVQIGIPRLYNHQSEVLQRLRENQNVVLATPTASGKSLAYFVPVLESIIEENATALFIYPLKALENDQLQKWNVLTSHIQLHSPIRAAIYDGDTSDTMRKKIRTDIPNVLMTTPEMLHLAILPFHALWNQFFTRLKYIVVDELHTYRGVFGTHMSYVFMRLKRISEYYGTKIQFVSTSATIANPEELGNHLFRSKTIAVVESGSPQPTKHYVLYQPSTTSAFQECVKVATHAIQNKLRTIVFSRSRQETERLYIAIIDRYPELKGKVSSYRAGYLPEERRVIESKLIDGEILGVFATSALELGIDIGGLDVCILNGFPGRIATMWQRWGRVGRGESTALGIMIASPNALDQYLVRHPEEVFSRSTESATINYKNSFILANHLMCAAAEIPLKENEEIFLNSYARETFHSLTSQGDLLESKTGGFWFSKNRRPHRTVDLRSIGNSYQIIDKISGFKIGTISGATVFRECHPGALYLHNGKALIVVELEIHQGIVYVIEEPVLPRYYTMPRIEKDTEIIETTNKTKLNHDELYFGKLRVHEKVTAYERRHSHTQVLENVHPLNLPETVFETFGCWITMDTDIIAEANKEGHHFPGSRHACEHSLLSMLPLLALCDRNDLGGITMDFHEQTKLPTIFLYDGVQGGAGLTELGFYQFQNWAEKTILLVSECTCEETDGCPSCVQSPKCGSGNRPLDKTGAIWLLNRWLQRSDTRELVYYRNQVKDIIFDPILQGEEETFNQLSFPTVSLSGKPIVYFDIETLRSAEEVGGWQNIRNMGVALCVVFDERTERFHTYFEKDIQELLAHLNSAEVIIGFNTIRFDYEVLRFYQPRLNFRNSFDLMVEIMNGVGGKRLPLSALAKTTLGHAKSADGLQSLEWVKQGNWQLIQEYCQQDVYLTKELFRFGLENGYVLYEDKRNVPLRIKVNWNIDEILERF